MSRPGSMTMNEKTRPVLTRRRLIRNAGLVALAVGLAALGSGWFANAASLRALGLVTLILAAAWLVCWPFTAAEPVPPAARRFVREFFPAIGTYMLLVVFAWGLVEQAQAPALKWALALVPVLPIIWVVRAMLRLLLASDELEQRIQLQAIAVAAVTVGLGSMMGGFLAVAGLVPAAPLLLWVLPALFAVYGGANWWIRRRYVGE